MVNRKRTQGKKLQAKLNKSVKTASHLLVCGLVLSSSILPVASVFAQGTDQTKTPSTQVDTKDSGTETTLPSVEPVQPTTETTQPSTQPSQEPTQPSSEPTQPTEETKQPDVDENGMTPEQVKQMQEYYQQGFKSAPASQEYVLAEDGFYYDKTDVGRTAALLDVTFNFVDKETGTVLGSSVQPKVFVLGANGVSASLGDAGIDKNVYGIPYEKNDLYGVDDEIYINDERTYKYERVSNGSSTYVNQETGKSKYPSGQAVFNVPVVKHDEPEAPKEEVSFKVRHVDENGEDIVNPSPYSGLEGEDYWVRSKDFTDYTLKEGEQSEYQGKYVKGMAGFTFHYVKKDATPAEQGVVTVKHVDIDTGKEIHEPTTEKGEIGSTAMVKEQSVKGYTFVPEKNEFDVDTRTVVFHSYERKVTLRYKKDSTPTPEPTGQGKVTFKYVDKDSKALKTAKEVTGKIGDKFSEKAPNIKGYVLDTENSPTGEVAEGKFTKNAQTYYFVYKKSDDKPSTGEDSKLRPVLEQAIKDAKPFVNKDKYQAKYVDVLDKAIKAGEKALEDNPAPKSNSKTRVKRATTDTDTVFQANIDAINTALKDVKANPVTPDPVAKGKVEVIFAQAVSQYFLKDPLVLEGKVGDKYSIDINDIPKELQKDGETLKINQKWFDEEVKPKLQGEFKEGTTTIPVIYGSRNSTPDPNEKFTIDINWVDQDGDAIKKSVQVEGKKGDKYDLSKYAVEIDGYKIDKSKLPTLTGVLTQNIQATFYYTAVSEPSNPDNDKPNTEKPNGDKDKPNTEKPNGDKDKPNTEKPNDDTVKPNGDIVKPNGDTVKPNGDIVKPNGDTVKPNGDIVKPNGDTVKPNGDIVKPNGDTVKPNGDVVKPNGDTVKANNLPQTGEAGSIWLTVAGLVALSSTAIALILKRKKA